MEQKQAENNARPVVRPGAALVVSLMIISLAVGIGLFLCSKPLLYAITELRWTDSPTFTQLMEQCQRMSMAFKNLGTLMILTLVIYSFFRRDRLLAVAAYSVSALYALLFFLFCWWSSHLYAVYHSHF